MPDLRHGFGVLEDRLASRQSQERFYAEMGARISHVLGDPVKALGTDWAAMIAERFTDADFACARAIMESAPPPRYVGFLREAGEVFATRGGQKLVVATTMERLLGHFLQVSMRARCSPDEVRLHRSTGMIELLLRGRPLAHLQAVSLSHVSEYALDRAEAFLSAIDGFDCEGDGHERLNAWLRPGSRSYAYGRMHIPSAAGWLRAACQLASQHGVHDGTLSLDERLAAAIVGASSWPMVEGMRSAIAGACGLWYLRRVQEGTDQLALYCSPLHAIAAVLEELSTGRIFPHDSVSISMHATSTGYPTMTVEADMSDAFEQVSTQPCDVVDPPDKWTARANRALRMGDARSLELAFGVYWSREERLRAYDSYHDQRLLVQSGSWRFTVNGVGQPKVLHAHWVDSTGRSVVQAAVRTRSGYLLRFQHLQEYVLMAQWMQEPVAVIDRIDKSTAEIVSDVLRGAGELRHSWRTIGGDARRELKSLKETMEVVRAEYAPKDEPRYGPG